MNDRENALNLAIKKIEKNFGKGAVMRLKSGFALNIESISTGSLGLDVALGIGGIPRGRVTELYGPESSGKTTLALHIIAETQKMGLTAAFIDAEHALDINYAEALGVDIGKLLVSQPDSGEQALEITDTLVHSGAVELIVVDSVAALVPEAEIAGEMGDAQMGLQARLMSQALRKMAGAVSKSKSAILFLNQLRQKIGVYFGNPETTTGGNALKFYASVRLDIRKKESIKKGDAIVGIGVRVKVVKNKVAPPFKQAEFTVMYGKGIDREDELLRLGVDNDLIEKSGAWYSIDDLRIGQGKEAAAQFLREHPDLSTDIEKKLRAKLGIANKDKEQKAENEKL